MSDITLLNECLACGSKNLNTLLDLGNQPLANAYTDSKKEKEKTYPLRTNVCTYCFHVQLTHVVNPALIYKDYAYVSGTSKTYLEYMEWFANFVEEESYFEGVFDIGCNDGSQLDIFKKNGHVTYGIDPAENLWPLSSKNHHVYCGFFDDGFIKEKTFFRDSIDVIVSQNSFAHNPNPLQFLLNCKKIMSYNGSIFIQTSQADMILNGEFDTIYHEHISFYNIKSMEKLCERAGLHLVNAIKTPIHGISYLFIITQSNAYQRPNLIANAIEMETKAGLYNKSTYYQFTQKANWITNSLAEMIQSKRNDGYTVIGYGAAAKGNTLLNFSKIKLDIIIDDNSLKQNKFAPGSKAIILSRDSVKKELQLLNPKKILFIPLAWNFYDEIRNKIKEFRNNPEDQFIKYFPIVQVSN